MQAWVEPDGTVIGWFSDQAPDPAKDGYTNCTVIDLTPQQWNSLQALVGKPVSNIKLNTDDVSVDYLTIKLASSVTVPGVGAGHAQLLPADVGSILSFGTALTPKKSDDGHYLLVVVVWGSPRTKVPNYINFHPQNALSAQLVASGALYAIDVSVNGFTAVSVAPPEPNQKPGSYLFSLTFG